MVTFPNLTDVYTRIAAELGGRVHLSRPVRAVARSEDRVLVTDARGGTEAFDQVIFACPAESALRLLSRPSPMERLVLGSVDYDEVSFLTHADADFMRRSYGADPGDGVQYYVRNSPADPVVIDMSFNLKRYQPHLADSGVDVFQTISPIEPIDDGKVFLKRVTRHSSAARKHLALTVPLWRLVEGRRRTWFCGAYTVFNVHEMAIVSGLAVADRLGAPYPFGDDPKARKQFELYCKLVLGGSRAKW
jgi:predicted NAD/FAD-binding protein